MAGLFVFSLVFRGAGVSSGNVWTVGDGVMSLVGVVLILVPFIHGGGKP